MLVALFGKFDYIDRLVLASARSHTVVECSQLEGNCWRCREKYTVIARNTNFNQASLFGSMYGCINADTVWLTVIYIERTWLFRWTSYLICATYSWSENYLTSYLIRPVFNKILEKFSRKPNVDFFWTLSLNIKRY